MDPNFVERVVSDAEAVAEVGVNLGRFKDPGQLLDAVAAVRGAQAAGTVAPAQIAALQSAMNQAVPAISPITLNDLRSGWRPFGRAAISKSKAAILVALCIILLFLTGSFTLLYDRTVAHLNMMQEFQSSRVQEAALRLYQFVKTNEEQVASGGALSRDTAMKEKLWEQLLYAYQIDRKLRSYGEITSYIDNVVNPYSIFSSYVYRTRELIEKKNKEVPSDVERYSKSALPYVGQNGLDVLRDTSKVKVEMSSWKFSRDCPDGSVSGVDNKNMMKSHCYIGRDLEEMSLLMSALGLSYDPQSPQYFFTEIFKRQVDMIQLGNWTLPALYGTLGAVIFYLRRFLDPAYPNPSTTALVFRIVLGGFAGIVVVWIWAPPSGNFGQLAFASIPSFGVAFLVGFSTEVFFQLLDRAVSKMQDALGK